MGIKLDTSTGAAQHDSFREASIRKQYLIVGSIIAVVFGLLIFISVVSIVKNIVYINKYEEVYTAVQQEYNALIASKQSTPTDAVSDNSTDKTERVVEVSTAVEAGERVAELQNALFDSAHKGYWSNAETNELKSLTGTTTYWLYNTASIDTLSWAFRTPFGVDPSQTGNKLYGCVWIGSIIAADGNGPYIAEVITADYDFNTGQFTNFNYNLTQFGKMYKNAHDESDNTIRPDNNGTKEQIDQILEISEQLEQIDEEESATDTDATEDTTEEENTDSEN